MGGRPFLFLEKKERKNLIRRAWIGEEKKVLEKRVELS